MHKHTIIPALALATLAAAVGSAQAAVVTQPAAVQGLRDLGHLSANTPIKLSVSLKLRNQAELTALLAAQSTPGSPQFRHFLTRTQVRDEFGASAADYARVTASLTRAGFTVRADPMRVTVHAVAPASRVENYFSTRLEAVSAGRGAGYVNLTAAKAPADTADVIDTVSGLNQSGAPRWQSSAAALLSQLQHGVAAKPAIKPAILPPTTGPDLGYGPQGLADAYDGPIVHGFFGNGVTIADIIDGPSIEADVNTYLKYFNLTRTGPATQIVNVNGGGAAVDDDYFQADIDEEGALGVAPGAQYIVYSIPDFLDVDIVDGFEAVVADNRADVVNFSVEGAESGLGETALTIDKYIQLGTAEGITFENVAFYDGSTSTAPSDSPNALSVGGADSYVGSGTPSPPLVDVTTGGGTSYLFPEPSYQVGLKGASKKGRNFPDIAGPAALNTLGPSVYVGDFGGWSGGFVFIDNAPVAGLLATADQLYQQRMGNINPLLYKGFNAAGDGTYFVDVAYGTSDGGLSAKKGYDIVSGVGLPQFYAAMEP